MLRIELVPDLCRCIETVARREFREAALREKGVDLEWCDMAIVAGTTVANDTIADCHQQARGEKEA